MKIAYNISLEYKKTKGRARKELDGRVQKFHVMEQGSCRSWKTWKVMDSLISFSSPGKSWNLGVGHGKSWKINTPSMSERQYDQKLKN